MTVSTFKSSYFKIKYRFLVYDYIGAWQQKVRLNFLIYSMYREKFVCNFNKSGSQALVYIRIRKVYMEKSRIMDADGKLQVNTSKVVAFDVLDVKLDSNIKLDQHKLSISPLFGTIKIQLTMRYKYLRVTGLLKMKQIVRFNSGSSCQLNLKVLKTQFVQKKGNL